MSLFWYRSNKCYQTLAHRASEFQNNFLLELHIESWEYKFALLGPVVQSLINLILVKWKILILFINT